MLWQDVDECDTDIEYWQVHLEVDPKQIPEDLSFEIDDKIGNIVRDKKS